MAALAAAGAADPLDPVEQIEWSRCTGDFILDYECLELASARYSVPVVPVALSCQEVLIGLPAWTVLWATCGLVALRSIDTGEPGSDGVCVAVGLICMAASGALWLVPSSGCQCDGCGPVRGFDRL